MNEKRSFSLSLPEIGVILFIIVVSVLLLLPARQGGGGSPRTQCRNNIRNLAMACLVYESYHKTLPPGGWGNGWAGDPNRSDGKTQPGGWMYAILPHLEQKELYLAGMEAGEAEKPEMIMEAQKTPIFLFHCPSRRPPIQYPTKAAFFNSGSPGLMAKTDYAGSGGDGKTLTEFVSGRGMDAFTEEDWEKLEPGDTNGVFRRRSGMPMSAITDGAAQTYLLGEKTLQPEAYLTGKAVGDDHGWNVGYDDDIIRFTAHARPEIVKPAQDKKGHVSPVFAFGSTHGNSFNMALADGSLQAIDYKIAPEVHANLGIRNDGQDMSKHLDD